MTKPTPNLDLMKTFDEKSIPDLDKVVLAALELFMTQGVPKRPDVRYKKPLVVGSGNAAVTGKIIFPNAICADESTYQQALDANKDIDGVVLISASGGKHAPIIAKDIKARKMSLLLITCNPYAPAIPFSEKSIVTLKMREPYTYNTSTYMGMILAMTGEKPEEIYNFIKQTVDPLIPKDFKKYDAYYLLVPESANSVREMFSTKFDELLQPKVSGRVFTWEQSRHAKTVVVSDSELFISFGLDNNMHGTKRQKIPLPDNFGPAAIMAIGYYVIGKIQAQNPPYFKEGIAAYCEKASRDFGSTIKPIVE